MGIKIMSKIWYPQKRNRLMRHHDPAVRTTRHEKRTDPAPFVMALLGEKTGRLTEDDLTPPEPKQRLKEEPTSFSDQVAGTLNPIVHALNKGKTITPKSQEHKWLVELLTKANID